MLPSHEFSSCSSFIWDSVNFISSSWYSVVILVQNEKNVSSTLILSTASSKADFSVSHAVPASRSTRSGREHGWDGWSRTGDPGVFYKLSAGLAITKVNPVLGIINIEKNIEKNLENKTEKNPTNIIMLTQFWGPKALFFLSFGGLKETSEITRGGLQKSTVSLKNNLKTTQYWERGALNALAPALFLHLSLLMTHRK